MCSGMGMPVAAVVHAHGERPVPGMLTQWAGSLGRGQAGKRSPGSIRSAFYGRVSTEDWQDPVTSRARQLAQAAMLVAGHGMVVAEFFDSAESRTLAWTRRPQAAALVAALAGSTAAAVATRC
jgi:site-specific DNA recombinase